MEVFYYRTYSPQSFIPSFVCLNFYEGKDVIKIESIQSSVNVYFEVQFKYKLSGLKPKHKIEKATKTKGVNFAFVHKYMFGTSIPNDVTMN